MNLLIIVVIIAVAFTAGVAWGRRGSRGVGIGLGSGQHPSESRLPRTPHGGYTFTDDVRKSLSRAREEAGLLGNEYVGPEHILLGLIHVNAGNGARVLERMHVETATLRARVLAIVQSGATHTAQDLPYTARAKRVLEKAMIGARDLGHDYVGTEHLLLGLAQDSGPVGQVLADAGADEQAVRRETLAVVSA
jgi:ATP-dependent Clp protease ATP-binding subunit ClpC